MLIDCKVLEACGSTVDHAEQMVLSLLEFEFGKTSVVDTGCAICHLRAIKVHLAVDQIIVRESRLFVRPVARDAFDERLISGVKPFSHSLDHHQSYRPPGRWRTYSRSGVPGRDRGHTAAILGHGTRSGRTFQQISGPNSGNGRKWFQHDPPGIYR